ncbi:Integrator complex subunit 3 [Smittium culicis]|uniref:Integrator complex subunit 3 n=1 Tax=Smittium culicis TaxID=133412 RepID=A0A1R1X1H0_9FUNG|nr:Integrator complex subunit 3 [Smittium culicis]
MNSFQKNLAWFSQQFLSTPESASIFCDIIRYICGVFHPTNQQLASDLVPRYVVLGALFRMIRSPVAAANIKLSLIYDFMFFDPQKDNIMNIEPFILLVERSLEKYSYLSATLIEFLGFVAESYSLDFTKNIRKSIELAMSTAIHKGVLGSLNYIYDFPLIPSSVKSQMLILFPGMIDTKRLKKNQDIATQPKLDESNSQNNSLIQHDSGANVSNTEVQSISLSDISHITKLVEVKSSLTDNDSQLKISSSTLPNNIQVGYNETPDLSPIPPRTIEDVPSYDLTYPESTPKLNADIKGINFSDDDYCPSSSEITINEATPEIFSGNIKFDKTSHDLETSNTSTPTDQQFYNPGDVDKLENDYYLSDENCNEDQTFNYQSADNYDLQEFEDQDNQSGFSLDYASDDEAQNEDGEEENNYALVKEKLQMKSLWIFGSVPSDLFNLIIEGEEDSALEKLKEIFQMYLESEVSPSDLGQILGLILQNAGLEDVEMNREFELDNNEAAIEHDLIYELCVLAFNQCKNSLIGSPKEYDANFEYKDSLANISVSGVKSLKLIYFISKELPILGYRWLIFIVLKNKRPDLYKFSSTEPTLNNSELDSHSSSDDLNIHSDTDTTSEFRSTLTSDLSLFHESHELLFYQSLYEIYKYFPSEIVRNSKLLFTIAKSIMQPQLHKVLFLISTSNLSLFGEKPSLVIPDTIDWESNIQLSVWQMIKAEISLSGDGALDLIDYFISNWNIDWSLHSESANGIFQILSSSPPHVYILTGLIYTTTLSKPNSIKNETNSSDAPSSPESSMARGKEDVYHLKDSSKPIIDTLVEFLNTWSRIDAKLSAKIDEIRNHILSMPQTPPITKADSPEIVPSSSFKNESSDEIDIKPNIQEVQDASTLFSDTNAKYSSVNNYIAPKPELTENNDAENNDAENPIQQNTDNISQKKLELFAIGSNDLKPFTVSKNSENYTSYNQISAGNYKNFIENGSSNGNVVGNAPENYNFNDSFQIQQPLQPRIKTEINPNIPLSSHLTLPANTSELFTQNGNLYDHSSALVYLNNNGIVNASGINQSSVLNKNRPIFPNSASSSISKPNYDFTMNQINPNQGGTAQNSLLYYPNITQSSNIQTLIPNPIQPRIPINIQSGIPNNIQLNNNMQNQLAGTFLANNNVIFSNNSLTHLYPSNTSDQNAIFTATQNFPQNNSNNLSTSTNPNSNPNSSNIQTNNPFLNKMLKLSNNLEPEEK